jgi:hypothetical protein
MYNHTHMAQKRIGFVGLLALLAGGMLATGYAQSQAQTPEMPVDEIIRRFSEKEKEFKLARENYGFRQEITVQELSNSDRVTGEYKLTVEVAFDSKGKRTEKVVYAPPPTLKNISLSPEDEKDFREIQPFVLTADEINKYNLKYAGKETIDQITAHVFDVSPKKLEKGERYFEGKIWVDDRDFQIVKTYGKSVPDIFNKGGKDNVFPRFETYREQIDDYWFPTYTRALDTLQFSNSSQKIREIIKYGNYKKFQTSVKLRFESEVTEGAGGGAGGAADKPADKAAPALEPKYKTDPKQEPKK